MRSKRISSIWSICGMLLAVALLFATAGYSSTILPTIVPHPGSQMDEDLAALYATMNSFWAPYDERYVFNGWSEYLAFRTWIQNGCYYGDFYEFDSYPRGSRYIEVLTFKNMYGTSCLMVDKAIHLVYVVGYDSSQYDNAEYIPDTTYVPDKNLSGGSCPNQVPDSAKPQFVGNPINAGTGNKYEPVTDLTVSTPGIPLEFRRYYNSAVIANGPLGYGWTHSYSMSATTVTTSTISGVVTPVRVKIIDADGRALYFTKIFQTYADGSHFYGESGVKDRLIINTSGQYILRRKDSNLTYTFDTSANGGKLLSISDTNGNSLTLTYTGTQLMQVSNNFGKAITFV